MKHTARIALFTTSYDRRGEPYSDPVCNESFSRGSMARFKARLREILEPLELVDNLHGTITLVHRDSERILDITHLGFIETTDQQNIYPTFKVRTRHTAHKFDTDIDGIDNLISEVCRRLHLWKRTFVLHKQDGIY